MYWITELNCSNIDMSEEEKSELMKKYKKINKNSKSFWNWNRLFKDASGIASRATRMLEKDYVYFNRLMLPILVVQKINNNKKVKRPITSYIVEIKEGEEFSENAMVAHILMARYLAECLLLIHYNIIEDTPGINIDLTETLDIKNDIMETPDIKIDSVKTVKSHKSKKKCTQTSR